MVYCDLVRATETEGFYHFGFYGDDLSGEVTFRRNGTCDIRKLPKSGSGSERNVLQIAAKYQKDFKCGIFKEKISYECG